MLDLGLNQGRVMAVERGGDRQETQWRWKEKGPAALSQEMKEQDKSGCLPGTQLSRGMPPQ